MTEHRFVVLSDLHAHPWAAFSRGDGAQNTRLQYALRILHDSLQRARELNCPWVFAGDIVHTAGYGLNVVLSTLVSVLAPYGDIDKLIVWGNHDARGIGGRLTLEQTVLGILAHAVERLQVLDPTCCQYATLGGLSFSGAGYQPRPDLLLYGKLADVGVYHQTVRGSRSPQGYVFTEGIDPTELVARHRCAVVGHVHHPQHLPHILIPGSPEHQTFGDQGPHGWYVVTLPEGTHYRTEFIRGGSPEFLTVETPADVRDDGNFYRVRTVRAGETVPAGVAVVAPEPTTIEQRDVLHGASGDAILETWMQLVPPPETADRPIVLAAGRHFLGAQEDRTLQPVRLTKLKLQNFCSYADATFEIRDGLWLVTGQGRDYQSNGAGKSTLFEALFWLLFGRTTKGLTGDEVLRWGAEAGGVIGTFLRQDGRGGIVVTRSREGGGKLHVTELTEGGAASQAWGAKSVTELTTRLGRYLGLTPELFQALCYFSQERLLLFASATDGERKEMLADLIGLSRYQEAQAAATTSCLEFEQLLDRTAVSLGHQETELKAELERLRDLRSRSQEWHRDRDARHAAAVAERTAFERERAARREQMLGVALEELTAQVTQQEVEATARLDAARALLAIPHQIVTKAELEATALVYTEALAAHVRAGINVAHARRLRDEAVLNRKQRERFLTTGTCPECGQTITTAHAAREMDVLDRKVADLSRDVAAAEQEEARALTARADGLVASKEAEARFKLGEQLAAARADAERALADLKVARTARAVLEEQAVTHVDGVLEAAAQRLADALARITAEADPFTIALQQSERRLTESERLRDAAAEKIAGYQDSRAVAEYWRHGFSKQGIQSLLVDEVAALFNATRGRIFPALTQGIYDVQFSTRSQTKGGEARERTEFQVLEHGRPVPYAALSGGQRRRVDVGVMLTLILAVAEWLQVPGVLGLLVLDEVFGYLDASGAEGLVEALRDMQQTVPAIYVVSHDVGLQALFPETLTVTQDADGISRIEEGE